MKTYIQSKSTIEQSNKRGRAKEKYKKTGLLIDDKSTTLTQEKNRTGGRAKYKSKSVSLGNGKYRVCKGKEGGKFKCRIITKKRALKKAGRLIKKYNKK